MRTSWIFANCATFFSLCSGSRYLLIKIENEEDPISPEEKENSQHKDLMLSRDGKNETLSNRNKVEDQRRCSI